MLQSVEHGLVEGGLGSLGGNHAAALSLGDGGQDDQQLEGEERAQGEPRSFVELGSVGSKCDGFLKEFNLFDMCVGLVVLSIFF